MGSEKIGTELQFRHLVAAECLRAGLALASLGLFSAAAAGEIRSPRPGLIVLSTLISWGIAAASVWLGHRMPLKAWRDGIAPAAISLTFAARGGLSAVGIGYVTLGFTVLQLASLLRANRSAISSIEASEDTVLRPEIAGQPAPLRAPVSAPRSSEPVSQTTEFPVFPAGSREEGATEPEPHLTPDEGVPTFPHLHSEEHQEPISESWTRKEFQGEVSIEAVVHARFDAGSRVARIHLPFIPPLPVAPIIETEPLESGCDVDIHVESAWRHGARLQVTRQTASESAEIPVGIVIYTAADEEVEYCE